MPSTKVEIWRSSSAWPSNPACKIPEKRKI
jgi:hypothetical protein